MNNYRHKTSMIEDSYGWTSSPEAKRHEVAMLLYALIPDEEPI